MTRRLFLAVMPLAAYGLRSRVDREGVERIRYQPRAGDVFEGPNGERIEVTAIRGTQLIDGPSHWVDYTLTVPGRGKQDRFLLRETWQGLHGWETARPI